MFTLSRNSLFRGSLYRGLSELKIDKLTWVHSSQSLILGDFPNKVKHSAGSHGFTENCGKALEKSN